MSLPPELWMMIFKHLRRLYFLDKVRKLEDSKRIRPLWIQRNYVNAYWDPLFHVTLNRWHSIEIMVRSPPIREPDDIVYFFHHFVRVRRKNLAYILSAVDARGNELREFF